jgi:hypothetical protein
MICRLQKIEPYYYLADRPVPPVLAGTRTSWEVLCETLSCECRRFDPVSAHQIEHSAASLEALRTLRDFLLRCSYNQTHH